MEDVLFCFLLYFVKHQFNCFLFCTVGLSYGTSEKIRGKKQDAFTVVFPVWRTQREDTKLLQLFTSGGSLISRSLIACLGFQSQTVTL